MYVHYTINNVIYMSTQNSNFTFSVFTGITRNELLLFEHNYKVSDEFGPKLMLCFCIEV